MHECFQIGRCRDLGRPRSEHGDARVAQVGQIVVYFDVILADGFSEQLLAHQCGAGQFLLVPEVVETAGVRVKGVGDTRGCDGLDEGRLVGPLGQEVVTLPVVSVHPPCVVGVVQWVAEGEVDSALRVEHDFVVRHRHWHGAQVVGVAAQYFVHHVASAPVDTHILG